MDKTSSIVFPGSLHNHTDFSNFRLRDSINTVETLINKAIELKHSVVAITEHETISSAVRAEKYYKKIKEENPDFKLLLGNEIYLCRNGLNKDNFNKQIDAYFHFVLLARDAIGHEQIRQLSTRAWMRAYEINRMYRVPTYYQDLFDIIGSNPGHVIGSTACLGGALGTQLLRAKSSNDLELYEKVKIWCKQLHSLFGKDCFYLEMQPSKNKEQIYVNQQILTLSEELNIPYIITNDAHYLKKEDIGIHHAFLTAQNGDRETESFYATTYLMTDEEIHRYMDDVIGKENVIKAYDTINHIVGMCENYSILKPLRIPYLPKHAEEPKDSLYQRFYNSIPALVNFKMSQFDSDRHLAQKVLDNISKDGQYQTPEAFKEINTCLQSVWDSSEKLQTRWSAYLLNVNDYIEIAWNEGDTLVGPSRGSGGGFILLNILGITQINPLKENTKTYSWRFMNPERVSPLDIDIDIEGSKREKVFRALQRNYGEERVSKVLTLRTEKSKLAVLTAARGLGIDVDVAQYLSSMVASDRGVPRTLKQAAYGDEENGIPANATFRGEMENNYPELWRVAQSIEGLICGVGSHSGGIIFVDEPFYKTTALMRTSNGDIVTQFDLHDAEDVGLIKIDLLSIEALDKIHICLDLLVKDGLIEPEPTLKETYEKVLGIYNIERASKNMWKMCWNHEVMSLFQMEKQSGISGISAIHPESVDDLAILNSVIRLMASEKGAEQPLAKFARYKADVSLWYNEMKEYGLTEDEIQWLRKYLDVSYGICESQEKLMSIVQDERVGGHSLLFADKLRKSIAKKKPKEFLECQKEFFSTIQEKNLSQTLASYIWNEVFKIQRGYSFCAAHTLAYSLVGLQELNLAYRFPVIYWNCACLIADSSGAEVINENENEENEFINETTYDNNIEDFDFVDDEEDDDDDDDEDGVVKITKIKKKKVKSNNYGKIASAIGKMKAAGIEISPPDINKSVYTFSPDAENNIIRHGLSGITRVGEDLVQKIMKERPFDSIEDFLSRVKVNKPQMINLIKSGAFDGFGSSRVEVMRRYIASVSDQKKRITLQNMRMLIEFKLLPEEFSFQCKVFNFNKYLKKAKIGQYYGLDNIAMTFFDANFDVDGLVTTELTESGFMISQTTWDSIYYANMDKVRPYVKKHHDELLESVNTRLMNDLWNKYCSGNLSKWEMDSISHYNHEHELSRIDNSYYGLTDFNTLSDEPDVDRIIFIKGHQVPLYKLYRIAGTVLDKDKTKSSITLLTTTGVVTVKIFGGAFTNYNKQISERGADGKKHVQEKSWFTRGNKVIITGIRRESMFFAKKYARTPFHLVELITDIDSDEHITTRAQRIGEEEC